MTNIETKIKEWLQEELESSRLIITEYTDENRPKCDDGSDDFNDKVNEEVGFKLYQLLNK